MPFRPCSAFSRPCRPILPFRFARTWRQGQQQQQQRVAAQASHRQEQERRPHPARPSSSSPTTYLGRDAPQVAPLVHRLAVAKHHGAAEAQRALRRRQWRTSGGSRGGGGGSGSGGMRAAEPTLSITFRQGPTQCERPDLAYCRRQAGVGLGAAATIEGGAGNWRSACSAPPPLCTHWCRRSSWAKGLRGCRGGRMRAARFSVQRSSTLVSLPIAG